MAGPYVTDKELLTASTGIDWTSVPKRNATTQQQAAEVSRMLRRATAWVTGQVGRKLWATIDTETLKLRGRRAIINRSGVLVVFTAGAPIRSAGILSVAYADDGVSFTTVTGTAIVEEGPERVPSYFKFVPKNRCFSVSDNDGWVQVVYLNGYANAHIAGNVLANASSLTVDDPTGILPGDMLTIYDDIDQEDVFVLSTYVTGNTTIPLVAPLQYGHAKGITISAMPDDIREATILYATDLVRQRGKDAVALLPHGGARLVAGTVSSRLDEAKELLNKYKRVL